MHTKKKKKNEHCVFQRLKGITEAIYLQAKYSGLRYEFVFTNLIPGNTRHFTSFIGVYK